MATTNETIGIGIVQADEPAPTRKRSYKIAAAITAAALIGAGVGYGAAQSKVSAAQQDAKSQIEQMEADAGTAISAAQDKADAKIAASEAEITARETAVGERETNVAAKESAVGTREAAVTQTEQAIDASKIQPGTYLVPEELSAGRYRTVNDVGGELCYMKQTKGDDIIDNMLESAGRPIFTVQNIPGSEFLIDSDCGPVQKI